MFPRILPEGNSFSFSDIMSIRYHAKCTVCTVCAVLRQMRVERRTFFRLWNNLPISWKQGPLRSLPFGPENGVKSRGLLADFEGFWGSRKSSMKILRFTTQGGYKTNRGKTRVSRGGDGPVRRKEEWRKNCNTGTGGNGDSMKTQPGDSKYYSTRDLAKLLGVDDSTVKRWADLGEIPCYKTLGGHRRFTPETVKDVTAKLSARISAQPPTLERTPGRR